MRGVILLCLLAAGCDVSDADLAHTLKSQGFTDIMPAGHAWFTCSKDDSFASKFVAKNAQGVDVHGAVCCGFLKGCTVRF